MDKAVELGNYISLVFPKFILNTPEFAKSREYLSKKSIETIIDFGEKGFQGVLIETLAIFINKNSKPKNTKVISATKNLNILQNQNYIFERTLPYWIIYRNEQFDNVYKKLKFDCFTVFRDREITNALLQDKGQIRVLKSRNISNDGKEILDIQNYDSYIDKELVENLSVGEFLDRTDVYLTPNMTYYPRVINKPKGIIVNGSVAILIPKTDFKLTKKQLEYFSTKEYREFYQIARNFQTRSLNIDNCSVYFFGILKE